MARKLHQTPIAIIGMASVFPNSMNLREFWDNIVNRADCIIDVPESRWKIEDYYDPDPKAPDKTYSKRGGFLPDIDFDPMEFGLPPNILEVTDVSQMLGLVVARDAMQDAGYSDASLEVRDRTGVVLGVGGGQKLITPLTSRLQYPVWRKALESSGIVGEDAERIMDKMRAAYIGWEENSFPGMLGNVIAGRITNRLDLGGTNCVVDAACASSMAAMKLAVAELVNGHADMMITGGVDTDNSPFMYMSFSKTPAFTPGDLPKPFDEESDGMMVGEGVGMIVLKRLADAERDGDRIYAVLRGMGSSSDGRYKSIYAPRGEGQEKALERAYDDAGISPSEVQLLEAHGTGTRAGDATETTTIVRFFNKHIDYTQSDNHQAIALGSVKSQIGHTKAAAGIAGIIKTALALHHKVLPATINVTRPNPKLGLDESPVYVNTQTRPWITNGTPRRAGVSSFGFGGTNFHFVFEEHNHDHKGSYRMHQTADTVIFHAGTPEALIEKMQKVVNNLRTEDASGQYLNLAQYSRVTNIPVNDARVGFVAGSADEAIELLDASIKFMQAKPTAEEWQHPKGIFYRRQALQLKGQVVALFSGQGSQYVNMGRELGLNFAPVRESFSKIDALFKQDKLPLVSNVVYPAPAFNEAEQQRQDQLIQRTDYVQPAIGALSAGLYQLFQRAGFQPDFVAGHSFGELTALWAGGVLNDDDYYRLVKARGLAMAPPADPNFDAGSMMAVTGDVSNLQNDIAGHNGVYMANINSPRQVVLAGNTSALATAKADLESKGYNVVNLPVSAAFHTPLVGHAQTPFAHAVAQADFKPARIPVYSNATAQQYPADADGMRRTLSEHILQSVNFRQEIENIYNAGGRVFIEFGPRNVLANLTKDILGDKQHVAIALNPSRQKDSDRQFREAIAHLRVLGLELAEVDPHASDPVKPVSAGRKKGMSVKINGGAYLSEGHKKHYQEILNDGFTVKGGGVREVVKEVIKEVPVEVIKEVEVIREVQVPVASNVAPVAQQASTPAPASATNFSDALSLFSQQQSETLKAHQQYLENQAEYIRIFTELTAQQQTAVQSGALSGDIASQISQSMDALHAHQAETLRVHETYLQRQSEQTQALIGAMRGGNLTPPTPPTAPVPPKASAPAVPAVTPAPVQQVVVPVTSASAPAPAPVQAVVAEPIAPVAVAPVANTSGITLEALSSALLNIVSDKTGYPSEMLELEMDIEADLGIDSIKRVEILGAMRDEFPSLPDLPAEDLAELRTLDEIVQYMAKVGGLNANATAVAPVASTPAPAVAEPVQAVAPVASAPVANASGITLEALSSALLNIVSDKTGYPSEMLELEMDIEADLGIDSIKRVEILGAMRDEFPSLPDLPAEDLAELRTLDEIVQYMAKVGGLNANATTVAPVAPAPVAQQAVVAEPVAPVEVAPVANTSGITLEALSSALLNIVSDKTGYPSEMLELEMDIEADLGIDSIKRVEILGAMRDEFPSLPDLPAEDLAELRTLDEIVQYMAKVGGLNANTTTVAPVAPASAPAPVAQQAVVAEPVAPVASAPVANASGITLEALSSALLNIVSDKTGYPSEMLELEMDIEADLGIDSIKRVEILGAMRDEFPSLPDLPAEDLAELRTLDEIVQYMAKVGGLNADATTVAPVAPASAPAPVAQQAVVAEPVAPVASAPVANASGITLEALSSALLNIVSDKTGYPSEMLELEMDIEADLGIDSIKRVEILGAMRDEFPSLPDLPAEDLAELRTLDEIVQYMAKVGGLNANASAVAPVAPVASTPAPVVAEPVQAVAPVASAPVANASGITLEALSSALLNIVSDKTGYPSEMLELEMDIEADLGIDSIKRVEILGAMRDEFPSLPDLPAEDLAELRTLDEIVQYMAKVGGASLNGNGVHAETDSPKALAPEKITGNGVPLALPKLEHDIPRVPAMIKRLPQPDFMDVQLPTGSVCLVTNDGTELTGLTAQKLIAQGWSVVVVNFSNEVLRPATLPAGIPQVQLTDTSETSIENAIKSINETYGRVAGYVQINPSSHNLGANGDLFVNKERELVKQAFLFAKHLKRQLSENASLGYALFATVARLDGAFGTSTGSYGAISGGLFGLTKTVNLEWAGVVCRALDIASDIDPQTASDALVAELHDPNRILVEVAINRAGRKTLVADVIV